MVSITLQLRQPCEYELVRSVKKVYKIKPALRIEVEILL